MAGTTLGSWWAYSTWIKNIARNARITEPTGAYLTQIRTALKTFWNPVAQTGTRPWLDNKFRRLATSGDTSYACDIDVDPANVIVEMFNTVGRDLKKIPLTDAEKIVCDAMISASSNRHLGTGPYFGGVAGDEPAR